MNLKLPLWSIPAFPQVLVVSSELLNPAIFFSKCASIAKLNEANISYFAQRVAMDIPDPDEFAARYAAALRSHLTPQSQPALLDWKNDDPIKKLDVDGFYIAATGKFLPKGSEPEMNERKDLRGSSVATQVLHNGSLAFNYYWNGSQWESSSVYQGKNTLVCHHDYIGVGNGIAVDFYGNMVVYLPHTTIYVVMNIAPLHVRLFRILVKCFPPETVDYSKVQGVVYTDAWRQSMAPSTSNSNGLSGEFILHPVVLHAGRRHVTERSAPEQELIARLCNAATEQFKNSSCGYNFQFYREIQTGLGGHVMPIEPEPSEVLVKVTDSADASAARRARMWALAQTSAGEQTMKSTLDAFTAGLQREEELHARVAELTTQLNELKAATAAEMLSRVSAATAELTAQVQASLAQFEPKATAFEELRVANRALSDIVKDGTPQKVEHLERQLEVAKEQLEVAGKREDDMRRRIAALRAESAKMQQQMAEIKVSFNTKLTKLQQLEAEMTKTLKSEEEENARLMRENQELMAQLGGTADGALMQEVYEELDSWKKKATDAEKRAEVALAQLAALRK